MLASALGAGFAAAYLRTRAAPALLTALAPAPVLFLVLFLVLSPVSKLVFPRGDTGVARAQVEGDTPVVMIVFDELSSASLMDAHRRIDGERYPSFARLTRDATWYRNATTVADVTQRAVPALLTGRRPDPDSLPIVADHPGNLFTLLGGAYEFDVIEPVTDLCPSQLCPERSPRPTGRRLRDLASDLGVVSLHLLLPEDLRKGLPAVDRTFGDFRDRGPDLPEKNATTGFLAVHRRALEDRIQQLEDLGRGLDRSSSKPALHYLHVQLPHVPWRYLPSGQQYPDRRPSTPGVRSERWTADPQPVRHAFQRYLLQLGFVDRVLGRILDRLRSVGLYERSLIVVCADHGVGFQPGASRRYVTRTNAGEIAGVPLIVKAPRQLKGRIDDSNVSTLDLLPTIADHLDLELPWPTDGTSALAVDRPRSDRITVRSNAGENVTLSLAEYERLRNRTIDEKLRLFGAGGRSGWYRFGPERELVGARLDTLAVDVSAGSRLELDSPGIFAAVTPRGAVVPALVTGEFTAGGAPDQRLAVALNGRIQATTRAYEDDGEVRFEAMLPPSALRRGRNRIEVLAIRTGDGTPRLATIAQPHDRLADESFTLTRRGRREILLSGSGREVAIRRGAVVGAYDSLGIGHGLLTVRGWSAAPGRRVPERVAVFIDGRLIVVGRPSRHRLGRHETPARRTGFELSGPIDRGSEVSRVSRARVFGIAGDRASELRPARR